MNGVLIRIGLRYAAAALIAKGIMSPSVGDWINSDPDVAMAVEVGVGLAAAGVAEGWYIIARRMGWET